MAELVALLDSALVGLGGESTEVVELVAGPADSAGAGTVEDAAEGALLESLKSVAYQPEPFN